MNYGIKDAHLFLLLAGLVVIVTWGIYIKIKDLVKKNSWHSVRVKIKDFLITSLQATAISLFVFTFLIFHYFLQDKPYINLFIVAYLFSGVIIYYYINGIKRRNTKNIKIIWERDLVFLKKFFEGFFQGIGILAKGLLILAGWLLAFGAIILVSFLFGSLIASLSATTIIIILLFLILLK